jgi:lipoprotein-anchoring transpeptidase ErfK/SrfK
MFTRSTITTLRAAAFALGAATFLSTVSLAPVSAQTLVAVANLESPMKVAPGSHVLDLSDVQPGIPREIVTFSSDKAPGTIIVNTVERRLYLVLENGKALRYGIGVGRPGFEWKGAQSITMKQEWPDWRPPAAMLKRRPDLPRFMKGGEENPLGARAMYLGSSIYRIHGSNEPESIGNAVSSGCIRMLNEDVIDLYGRVQVGTRVVVI